MRKYLELIRLPNVLTAACDVWAGYFIILAIPDLRGAVGDMTVANHALRLILLAPAGCLFYAAGVIFNDVVDFKHDKTTRPERPLPSGRISLNVAFALGVLLAIAGLSLCMMTGSPSRPITGFVLLACIVAYNVIAKHSPVAGPVVMALCRALNIALGMGLTFAIIGNYPLVMLAPAIMFAYVLGVSLVSLAEKSSGVAEVLVKWGVLGVAFLDAVFVMAYGQTLASLFCLAMFVAAVALSRKFAVT